MTITVNLIHAETKSPSKIPVQTKLSSQGTFSEKWHLSVMQIQPLLGVTAFYSKQEDQCRTCFVLFFCILNTVLTLNIVQTVNADTLNPVQILNTDTLMLFLMLSGMKIPILNTVLTLNTRDGKIDQLTWVHWHKSSPIKEMCLRCHLG